MAWFGLYKSDDEKRADAAADAKIAQDKQNAIALSNYRQTSRDDYNRLGQNEFAQYSPYMARLAARYGTSMPGMPLGPVSLADSGVGAAQGSNFTGWDTSQQHVNPITGQPVARRDVVHHTGISEYLNGTGLAPGTETYERTPGASSAVITAQNAVPGGVPQDVAANQGISYSPMGAAPPQQTQPSFFPGKR